MKNFYFSIAIFLFAVMFSCEKENIELDGGSQTFLRSAIPLLERGNAEVKVTFYNPRIAVDYISAPTEPEEFTILYGKNPENLAFSQTIEANTETYTIDNLENDVLYFIRVISLKPGLKSDTSQLYAAMPSSSIPFSITPSGIEQRIQRVISSPDGQYILFESNQYAAEFNQGNDALFYKSINDSEINAIDNQTFGGSWSPSGKKVAYTKYEISNNKLVTKYGILFDLETETKDTLLAVSEAEILGDLKFHQDDNQVIYSSNLNNVNSSIYNIWSIEVDSRSTRKISDFEAIGFNGTYGNWRHPSNLLYFTGYFFENNDLRQSSNFGIYQYDLSNNNLAPIVLEPVTGIRPSPSPNNQKVAFYSSITGDDEIWIYDLSSNEYTQLTEDQIHVDGRYDYIEWVNENEIRVTAFVDGQQEIIQIKVS